MRQPRVASAADAGPATVRLLADQPCLTLAAARHAEKSRPDVGGHAGRAVAKKARFAAGRARAERVAAPGAAPASAVAGVRGTAAFRIGVGVGPARMRPAWRRCIDRQAHGGRLAQQTPSVQLPLAHCSLRSQGRPSATSEADWSPPPPSRASTRSSAPSCGRRVKAGRAEIGRGIQRGVGPAIARARDGRQVAGDPGLGNTGLSRSAHRGSVLSAHGGARQAQPRSNDSSMVRAAARGERNGDRWSAQRRLATTCPWRVACALTMKGVADCSPSRQETELSPGRTAPAVVRSTWMGAPALLIVMAVDLRGNRVRSESTTRRISVTGSWQPDAQIHRGAQRQPPIRGREIRRAHGYLVGRDVYGAGRHIPRVGRGRRRRTQAEGDDRCARAPPRQSAVQNHQRR